VALSSTLVGGHKYILLCDIYKYVVQDTADGGDLVLRRHSEHVSYAVTFAVSSMLYTLVPTRKPIYYTTESRNDAQSVHF